MRSTVPLAGVLFILILGATGLLTPLFGQPGPGMMHGPGMGPMSRGMMREVHGMADFDTEFDYMVRMIPHHQEAVESARILRDQTNRPEMVSFAETIIATQTREIEQMREWLVTWYPDRDTDVDYTPMMRDYSNIEGEELDLAFLQDMIPHHMAAVMMSEQLLSRVPIEHREVGELASNIRTTQTREIRQMGLWLRRWYR